MSVVVGTNSWATVAEADAYFATKWNAKTIWENLNESDKNCLLISAYKWIQQQAIFSISPSSTSDIVKEAQYEAAWYMYNFWTSTEKRRALYSQGVRDFEISEFSETLERPEFPAWIADILKDSLTGAGGKFPLVSRTIE